MAIAKPPKLGTERLERLVTREEISLDAALAAAHDLPKFDTALRPTLLSDFVGQTELCSNLKVFVEATRRRGEPMDHILISGPPGLGKTTLAQIIANELGVGFRATSGPVITKGGDLAGLLTSLQEREVLFIDEIHRLNPMVEELLYPALEDRRIDLMIGEGPGARSVQIDLKPFTLVAATTRTGLVSRPLRDRFGIPLQMRFYSPEELLSIVERAARLLGMSMSSAAAMEIARRSRGTPRIAGRLLRRIRDFAEVAGVKTLEQIHVDDALTKLDVDRHGLDAQDRRYLSCITTTYEGGPVGAETLAANMSEARDVLEDVIEPYLMQLGLLMRTPRGRMLGPLGWEYMGLKPKSAKPMTDDQPLPLEPESDDGQ
ncbi:MAG: Holliday junction branch migration DNA helicase RuvB [Alphaproteobacteria bacterium]|nr:Holliday junction branch migration DNA helicase RuvB [Alphaproteobacteria bacterium]